MASYSAGSLKILSAEVTSVIERQRQKSRYAFEINASWSNGGKSTCHRSYQEFFEFHCKLLDQFPSEAGTVKSSTRTIPFLPGKKLFRRSNKRLAEERLPSLHQYTQELVSLPENISGCTLVKTFIDRNFEANTVQEIDTCAVDTKDGMSEQQQTQRSSIAAITISSSSNVVTYSPSIRSNSKKFMATHEQQQQQAFSNVTTATDQNDSSDEERRKTNGTQNLAGEKKSLQQASDYEETGANDETAAKTLSESVVNPNPSEQDLTDDNAATTSEQLRNSEEEKIEDNTEDLVTPDKDQSSSEKNFDDKASEEPNSQVENDANISQEDLPQQDRHEELTEDPTTSTEDPYIQQAEDSTLEGLVEDPTITVAYTSSSQDSDTQQEADHEVQVDSDSQQINEIEEGLISHEPDTNHQTEKSDSSRPDENEEEQ